MLKSGVAFGILLFAAGLTASEDGPALLARVAEKYSAVSGYEFEGIEAASLSSGGCSVEIPFVMTLAATPPAGQASRAPTARFSAPKFQSDCVPDLRTLGGFQAPAAWAQFDRIDEGVSQARVLPEEILDVRGEAVRCFLLEVVYVEYYQKLKGVSGSVRYWVDVTSHLIRRVEFTEETAHGLRAWTATINSGRLGGSSLGGVRLDDPAACTNSKLVGGLAPTFTLPTTDGDSVRLLDLRGKTVFLAFWATWCMACDEELPSLERLQGEQLASRMAVLGVSAEGTLAVRKWLDENHRRFRTLANAKTTFRTYGIKALPAMVEIDPNGVVANCFTGFHSSRRIRQILGLPSTN